MGLPYANYYAESKSYFKKRQTFFFTDAKLPGCCFLAVCNVLSLDQQSDYYTWGHSLHTHNTCALVYWGDVQYDHRVMHISTYEYTTHYAITYSTLCTHCHTQTPRFLRMILSLWKSLPVALSLSLLWWLTSLECLGSHHLSL